MENFNFETPKFEPAKQISKEEILKKAGKEDENAKKFNINTLEASIDALKRQIESTNNEYLKIALEAKMEEAIKKLEKISNTETIH